jgi:pimeloyl-ACP methyl ester carboxylesterase
MPVSRGLYYSVSEGDNYARPPVVLIHGAGGHHLYWPPQVRRLQGQRMLALDLPGHGKSSGTGHQTIEAYASEVAQFIQSIGLSTAVLLGHSMGGAIALEMTSRNPKRVLGLGLLATGARLPVAPEILQAAANPATFLEAVALLGELSFAPQTSLALRRLGTARLRETRPSVLHGDLLACNAFDMTARLADMAVPTIILCGAEDNMTPPKYSAFLQARIHGASLNILPGAGHMVMLEQPDEVAAQTELFVNSIQYRPGA